MTGHYVLIASLNENKQGETKMVSLAAKSDNGEVRFMWVGNNGTYWAKIAYWIGVGYQCVDRQVSKDTYDLWNL